MLFSCLNFWTFLAFHGEEGGVSEEQDCNRCLTNNKSTLYALSLQRVSSFTTQQNV